MCYGYVKSLQGPKGAHELEMFILLVNILIGDDINKIGYTTQRAYNIHIYMYTYYVYIYIHKSEWLCFFLRGYVFCCKWVNVYDTQQTANS